MASELRRSELELRELRGRNARLEQEVARLRDAEAYLGIIFQTRGWRTLDRYYHLRAALRQRRSALRLRAARVQSGRLLSPIRLSPATAPSATIVIPVHGNAHLTERCLRAVARHTPPGEYEVIVADDASSDRTPELLASVEGLVVSRSETNLGFVDTCNRGAAAARGQFVLFLNNDTEVQEGWLDALLDAARSAPDVGAVGSKLVYPDGRLQEAGGVVWSDGSAMNAGGGGDPRAPQFNYRREVDYCSAASLLVRRGVWERLGGFDRAFAPGYYEDTDLCMALRKLGYRTLYEPTSVVVHHEGATHGTDRRPRPGAGPSKVHQTRNRRIFAAKWERELARHWPPQTAYGRLRGRIDHRPRVLFADEWVPQPDRNSGGQRAWWIVALLRELGCEVTLVPTQPTRTEPYVKDLQRLGIEVYLPPRTFGQLAHERQGEFDLVILSRPTVATELVETARRFFPRATLLYDTVDLHFLREERKASSRGGGDRGVRVRQLELASIARCDLTATVTEVEAELLRETVPGARTIVLPNVHEVEAGPSPPFAARADVVFIGGFLHDPNVDAMLWFTEEVWPRVAERTNARLWILGSDPPEEIVALRSGRVVVTGFVPDVGDHFRTARVFVSPLRYGAGMKGKVGQALAYGLPVVTTSIGAEGMDIVDGRHALVRDDPEAFADAVVSLYRNEEVWARLSAGGRDLLAENWSPEVMRGRLERLLAATVRTAGLTWAAEGAGAPPGRAR